MTGQRIWACFDEVIAFFFCDDNVHVRKDKPQWLASDKAVLDIEQEFRARNAKIVPVIRRIWAGLCLVGIFIWLFLDIFLPGAGGLVPGLRDNYVINAQPLDSSGSKTTIICSCTYESSRFYSHPPYTVLAKNKDADALPDINTFLGYCSSPDFNVSQLTPDTNSFLLNALQQYVFRVTLMRIPAPTTATQLSREGWTVARFGASWKMINDAANAARSTLFAATLAELSDQDFQMGLRVISLLETSFNVMLGKLLGLPPDATTVEILVDDKKSVSMNCSEAHATPQLPLALQEWCRPKTTQVDQDDNKRNCDDPYEAYIRWCAPAMCNELAPKSGYIQAMQILAAMGGLYSLIGLFAITFIWQFFTWAESKVALEPWLQGLCSCFGGPPAAHDTVQAPQQVVALPIPSLAQPGQGQSAEGEEEQPPGRVDKEAPLQVQCHDTMGRVDVVDSSRSFELGSGASHPRMLDIHRASLPLPRASSSFHRGRVSHTDQDSV